MPLWGRGMTPARRPVRSAVSVPKAVRHRGAASGSVFGALRSRLPLLGDVRIERRPSIGGAVVLDARDPQARDTMPFDHALPAEELLHRQAIALTSLFEADQATANRCHDLRLAANDPTPDR